MTYIIDVKKLTKSFGNKRAVNGIDMQVERGEIYGFLGPNGSGKTTTIRMLCGLLRPDSGEGHCLGYDIVEESQYIKQEVGYMTQNFSFYEDLTIRENLNFVANIYQMERPGRVVDETIEQLGIPKERKNQLVRELSGGWKQRLALAAAMLHKPKLLLLDEPTAGVDPQARRDFWNEIHRFAEEGITTLVSTHYMDEAERCHRLAYIASGYLLTKGTAKEIIQASQLQVWSIADGQAIQLADKVCPITKAVQVTPFGQTLHVAGRDEKLLEKVLNSYRGKYEIQQISPNLEDVFIYLISESSNLIDEMCICSDDCQCLEGRPLCERGSKK
jgi:ABC-2 type transport system ATP-binding protein